MRSEQASTGTAIPEGTHQSDRYYGPFRIGEARPCSPVDPWERLDASFTDYWELGSVAPLTHSGDTGNNEAGGQSYREQNSRAECGGEKKEYQPQATVAPKATSLAKLTPF